MYIYMYAIYTYKVYCMLDLCIIYIYICVVCGKLYIVYCIYAYIYMYVSQICL